MEWSIKEGVPFRFSAGICLIVQLIGDRDMQKVSMVYGEYFFSYFRKHKVVMFLNALWKKENSCKMKTPVCRKIFTSFLFLAIFNFLNGP